MKHVFASPFHPQTNGKLERYHRTAKAKVNVFVHHSLEELVAAMEDFVRYYNYERLSRGFGEHHAGGYVPRTARRHTGDETGGEAK